MSSRFLSGTAQKCSQDGRLKVYFSQRMAVGAIPANRLSQSLAQRMFRLKSDRLLDTAYVQTAPRLTIGFGRIPLDLSLISDFLGDEARELPDRNLFSGSKI